MTLQQVSRVVQFEDPDEYADQLVERVAQRVLELIPPPAPMGNQLLSLEEVGEVLGVHRDTVNQIRKRGHLPSLKIGGSVRILRTDVDAYIARMAEEARDR